MNETIRTLIKTILPFLMLIVVSLLTQPEDKERLDRFYVKMRTEVKTDREEDAREMELSYADPQRYSDRKWFPNSNWELLKCNRVDVIGFSLAFACIFAVLGFLKLLVSLGG